MPNGEIESECVKRLKDMGDWMTKYGYTIYGTQEGFIKPQTWGAVTKKGKTYFIHILDNSITSLTVNLPHIKSAKWVNTGFPMEWKKDKKTGDVSFTIKGVLDSIDSIIEVEVK